MLRDHALPEVYAAPQGLAFDRLGHVLVLSWYNHTVAVCRFDTGEVIKTIGRPGENDILTSPVAVCVDWSGRIFVLDQHKRRIQIFAFGCGSI